MQRTVILSDDEYAALIDERDRMRRLLADAVTWIDPAEQGADFDSETQQQRRGFLADSIRAELGEE